MQRTDDPGSSLDSNGDHDPGTTQTKDADADDSNLNEDDYDGDNSDGGSEDADSSDGEDRHRVVTFLDMPKEPSPEEAPSVYSDVAGIGVGQRVSSNPDFVHRREPSSTSRLGLLDQRSPRRKPLRMHIALSSHARSYSAISQLKTEQHSTLTPGQVHANTPTESNPESMPHLETDASRSKSRAGPAYLKGEPHSHIHSRSHSHFSSLPRDSMAAHWAATPENYEFPRRYHRQNEESAPTTPPETGSSSPMLEQLGFPRARTLSVYNVFGHADTRQVRASSVGSIHSLPRILTMSSVKEKDGGDMETGIDDLPPMRLGREITNDLRRIELTFSNQPEKAERAPNPLKHLIKSRHNFRALVTYGGYLIPINILLNVILLGRGWLQYDALSPDGSKTTVNNPVGYLVSSVISLILIVISGFCFVLRCLEFDVLRTTMTSIITNFINAVLILASAIMFRDRERSRHPDAHLTGEYYSSYAGAVVALLNALLLLLDVLITPGFRYRGSGMSRQQRMLQFNIILVVVWIGIGGYAWSKIENWDTITSIMFCMVTVTTIGFGNTSPTKTYSRILQLIYGPLGILMFGLMLLHTRNVIIQITRAKIHTARREIEAKRRKIEQDVTLSHVKRRLAARPQHRSWHEVFTDMLGRIFLSKRRRVRIGIPHWLRRKLEEDPGVESGGSDLELGNSRGDWDNGQGMVPVEDEDDEDDEDEYRLPVVRPLSPLDVNRTMTEQTLDLPHEPLSSRNLMSSGRDFPSRLRAIGRGRHSTDQDEAPFPMERSYTTASRLSQVREAILQPGFWGRMRVRLGLHKKRKPGEDVEGGKRSDYDDRFSDEGDSNDDNDDEYIAGGIDAPTGQTIQGDNILRKRRGKSGQNSRTSESRGGGQAKGAKGRGKGSKRGGSTQQTRKERGIRNITKQLWAALTLNICFWCMSAGIFYAFERRHWSYFDAMYFCYVAFTTIGYGDIVPQTTEGEIVFICLCFIAVALETFLVVSAVSFFSDLLGRGMRRTKVQSRIEKRRRRLVAYEIRRHIKHPNYNPFSHGEEDRAVHIGVTRLKKAGYNIREVLKGRKSLKEILRSRHSEKDRKHDRTLTEGFIRHATGMGGFGPSDWQPASPPASLISDHSRELCPRPPLSSPVSRASVMSLPDDALHNSVSNDGGGSSSPGTNIGASGPTGPGQGSGSPGPKADPFSSGLHINQ
ncbi:hypothetical protein GQ54DRAFT_177191 [Martensiomyces pterosporus]|nr:hypothetical protein GQ54DRAFT_177191 [Martensiomyces pterosporus]